MQPPVAAGRAFADAARPMELPPRPDPRGPGWARDPGRKRRESRPPGALRRLCEPQHGPPSLAASHSTLVGDDRKKPGPSRAQVRPDAVAMAPALERHLLHRILGGSAVAEHRQGQPESRLNHGSQDLLERVAVALPSPAQQVDLIHVSRQMREVPSKFRGSMSLGPPPGLNT